MQEKTWERRRFCAGSFRSTLMLCPSYSKGKFSFSLSAPSGLAYGSYTLWCNTCSALPEGNSPAAYVGLIAAPDANIIHYFEPQCGGRCGSINDPCLFLVEIKRTGMAPEITVQEHICTHTERIKKEEKS